MIPNIILNLPQSPRMVDVLRQSLNESERAYICVSFLRFSGLSILFRELNDFLNRGGKLQLLTSTYLNVTQPDALAVLMNRQGIEVRVQDGLTGFHTKFYFFAQSNQSAYCLVGSSNLTKSGLSTNIEWNIKHEGQAILEECKNNFIQLCQRNDVFALNDIFLAQYKEKYQKYQANLVSFNFEIKENIPSNIYQPNDPQKEALKELTNMRLRGERKAAIIAATGLGKTFLAAFDAQTFQAKNLLFIAHREELLQQAEDTFKKVFGEHLKTGILAGGKNPKSANFIFATIQSLSQESKAYISNKNYDYVVVDEFHHASAPSYKKILDLVKPNFLLGITATPERRDGHDVLEICDYNIAYEIRLPEAINRGWLVPFHYFGIADELVDYSVIKWRNGKFDPYTLENALTLEERVDIIIQNALEKGYDGKFRATVGFCAGVRHAKFMADAFNKRGFTSEAVTGEINPEQRLKIYERFKDANDPLEWLFVSDVLNEGVDIPAINSILFLRPTESPGLFLQQLGRGLRLHPDIEVLTVLDFVGHHKNAWLSLNCLNDSRSNLDSVKLDTLGVTPPHHCEIILEDKTKEILLKIKALNTTQADRCKEAYERLKAELERPPQPIDFWGRKDMPNFQEFKQAFSTWLDCRQVMGDASPWELSINQDSKIYKFLKAVEADWQAQRVTPYAVLWSLCYFPNNLEEGFEEFFNKYPHWQIEKPKTGSYGKAFQTLEKKLPKIFIEGQLIPEIQISLKKDLDLAQNVEERIKYTLASNYRLRHCGNLRQPQDLVLYAKYRRNEIINHFGIQYDPAKHNSGVIKFSDNQIVVITKLDTSSAPEQFRYKSGFLDSDNFSWQSQNRMTQYNELGQEIINHKNRGNKIHLFVQQRANEAACYIGIVEVVGVRGNSPMNITFKMSQSIPESIFNSFTQN